jgi:hypothetical protein
VAFEDDLQRVVRRSNRRSPAKVTAFLKADAIQDREWCGGLFEIAAKARLLRIPGLAVELDFPLPNGREADALLNWRGSTFSLECTVITDSDEDREAWDRFVAELNAGKATAMIRPGPFDSKNARSPSPYYDTIRIYAKVYDKLAPELQPGRTQFLPDVPSLLLMSSWSSRGTLAANSPGVGWALDELFADQPRRRSIAEEEPGIDIALGGWIDFTAKTLLTKGRLAPDRCANALRELMAAPRKLGGILLFNECSFAKARLNYNARPECRPSHREMSDLEAWLGGPPYWA